MKQISLEAARVDAGMTQQELAERLGVTRKTVRNWEKGKHAIKKSMFDAFCAATGFEKEDIFLP